MKEKMETWIANGAKLGWLVDPRHRHVLIYEPGKKPHVETGNKVTGSGPVEAFALDLTAVWILYETEAGSRLANGISRFEKAWPHG
jgi:Uma2 family endonuclease